MRGQGSLPCDLVRVLESPRAATQPGAWGWDLAQQLEGSYIQRDPGHGATLRRRACGLSAALWLPPHPRRHAPHAPDATRRARNLWPVLWTQPLSPTGLRLAAVAKCHVHCGEEQPSMAPSGSCTGSHLAAPAQEGGVCPAHLASRPTGSQGRGLKPSLTPNAAQTPALGTSPSSAPPTQRACLRGWNDVTSGSFPPQRVSPHPQRGHVDHGGHAAASRPFSEH